MSEADAEIVRHGYAAVARGDRAAGEHLLAPDARWHAALGGLMGQALYEGREEIERLVFEDIPSVLDGFRPEVLEVRDLGGGLLLAVVRWRATLRASGLTVDQVFGQLCHVRRGRWQELWSYESVDAALAALPEIRARVAYDNWNRGDIDAVMASVHPDVVLEQDPAIPGAETVRGRDALRAWLEGFADAWASFTLEPERVVTAGDRAIVVLRIQAVARSSGVPVVSTIAHAVRYEDGLAREWRSYADPEEALAAVRSP